MIQEMELKGFLWDMINYAPVDSTWGIQGLYEEETIDVLMPFFIKEGENNPNIFADYFIKLTEVVKKQLKNIIFESNIINDIVEHQYISKDGIRYFESYDGLQYNILLVDFLPLDIKEKYIKIGLLEE